MQKKGREQKVQGREPDKSCVCSMLVGRLPDRLSIAFKIGMPLGSQLALESPVAPPWEALLNFDNSMFPSRARDIIKSSMAWLDADPEERIVEGPWIEGSEKGSLESQPGCCAAEKVH